MLTKKGIGEVSANQLRQGEQYYIVRKTQNFGIPTDIPFVSYIATYEGRKDADEKKSLFKIKKIRRSKNKHYFQDWEEPSSIDDIEQFNPYNFVFYPIDDETIDESMWRPPTKNLEEDTGGQEYRNLSKRVKTENEGIFRDDYNIVGGKRTRTIRRKRTRTFRRKRTITIKRKRSRTIRRKRTKTIRRKRTKTIRRKKK